MNFAALRKRVRETASLTTDDDVQVGAFVNEACVDFARDAATNPIRFSFNTIAGTADYDLMAAGVTPNGVIRFLPDDEDAAITHTYDFTVRGLGTLVLDPKPGAVGAVTGWLVPRPATLVLDADTPVFPSEYHRAIVYRALQLTCEWDRQDPADIQMWEGKYEAEVLKARRERTRGRTARRLTPSSKLNASSVGIMRVP